MYEALNGGNVDVPRLRQVLAGLPQPEAADGRLVLAVDVTHWLRPDAPIRRGVPLGSLAPGTSTTSTGTLTHMATVAATPSDPVSSDNTATASTSVNNARGCTIIGTSGPDTLSGGYGNDVICGLGGNDTVRASYGHDTVHGGHGNDNLDGSFGDDTIDGGPGNDTANGGYGTDTCTTDPGDARISCP